jgi:hypothetical protein
MFKDQISSLFINFYTENYWHPMGTTYSIIFTEILTKFTNLRCLKFNPSTSNHDTIFVHETAIYSTLLELHVSVTDIRQCLLILDGRFDQLRILYITWRYISRKFVNIEHKVGFLINILFV